jgi:hypothetical protein
MDVFCRLIVYYKCSGDMDMAIYIKSQKEKGAINSPLFIYKTPPQPK